MTKLTKLVLRFGVAYIILIIGSLMMSHTITSLPNLIYEIYYDFTRDDYFIGIGIVLAIGIILGAYKSDT